MLVGFVLKGLGGLAKSEDAEILPSPAGLGRDGAQISKAERESRRHLPKSRHLTRAILLAGLAGLLLLSSGAVSSSILLTGLKYTDTYIGPGIGPGRFLLDAAVATLTFVVGLGGLLDFAAALLLWREHGSAGRFLLGLGGGTAIFGLMFSVGEALFVSGLSAPLFHQAYFILYLTGALLATSSILFSRRAPATKPVL